MVLGLSVDAPDLLKKLCVAIVLYATNCAHEREVHSKFKRLSKDMSDIVVCENAIVWRTQRRSESSLDLIAKSLDA